MATTASVRRAQVSAQAAAEAVRRFYGAVVQPDMALVLFFCSPRYDLNTVAAEMQRLFGDVPVVGCTTAGEIGNRGYADDSIVGASFPADRFAAVCRQYGPLEAFVDTEARKAGEDLLIRLQRLHPSAGADNTFAFLMVDGLSMREEAVTEGFQSALAPIPLIGGSAGDGLNFDNTWVYCDGSFHANSAVLVLVSSDAPFRPLMAQHFQAGEERIVVTAADTARRIVHEIDGRPAAKAYADLIGAAHDDLGPTRFAASPVAEMIDGVSYVRSINRALPDGSLKFYCAVGEGTVLRLAHGGDLLDKLERDFAALNAEIGEPEIIVGCDCILRRLEIEQRGLARRVAEVLDRNRVVGFVTYGEQYRGIHVNQTFTGIAIGNRKDA